MTEISLEVLRLMRQYQAGTSPFWLSYLTELQKRNLTLDHAVHKDTTKDAYDKFVEQTEPARKKWEEKVKELRKQGIIP